MKKTRLELCIIILIACSMLSLAQQICYGASGWCCEEGRCACQYPEGCYGSDGNIYGSISEFEADLNKPSPGYGQTTPAPKECYEISGWCCEGGACTCQHSGGCYGKNGNIYGSISESEADLTSLPPGYGQITPASGEGKEAGVSGGTAEEISGKCTKEQCKQIDKVWLRIGQALGISKANEKQVWDEGWFISDDVYRETTSGTVGAGDLVSIKGIEGINCIAVDCWLKSGAKEKLVNAGRAALDLNYKLQINDAYRSLEKQKSMWKEKGGGVCPKYPKGTRPTDEEFKKCPHVNGIAVDVRLWDIVSNKLIENARMGCMGATCGASGYYDPNNVYQQLLRAAMVGAGFEPWDNEWWHFKAK